MHVYMCVCVCAPVHACIWSFRKEYMFQSQRTTNGGIVSLLILCGLWGIKLRS